MSVITVCYNAEATIAATLHSLRDQTDRDFELIIIDGASQDATLAVINSISGLQPRLISEPDNGLYDAMNKGLKLARGRYVSFLNADDSYLPHTVALVKEAFRQKEAQVYYGDIEKVRHYNNRSYHKRARPDLSAMPRTMGIFHPATFVCRRLFATLGPFNTRYKLAADYHWFLRAYLHEATFCYIPEVLTRFSIGGRSNLSCESYSEAAVIQKEFNTGHHLQMQKLYVKCRKKAFRQRLINKFVQLWPFNKMYQAYLRKKWH